VEAQRWLAAAEMDMFRADWHDPRLGDIPFGEWSQQWLATKAPHVKESKAELYRYLLRRRIVPCFGRAPVGRITPADVQAWLAAMHSTHLNANTVGKAYRVLRRVIDDAVDVGLISRSRAPSRVPAPSAIPR
jgi:hypothetical protein